MSFPLGLTLVSTQTASAQSSLAFVPATTYDTYILMGSSVLNSVTTGTSMVAQISTDGGSTYINSNYGNADIGLQLGFLDGGTSQLNFSAYIMNSRSSSSYVGSISNTLRSAFPAGGTYGDYYMVANTTANAFQLAAGDGSNFSGTFSLYGVFDQIVTPPSFNPSPSAASRSLNTAFQISSTRNCLVSYSVDVSCSMTLTAGQTGTVTLQYADNSGFTTNVVEVCRTVNGNSGTLTLGLNLVQDITAVVSGFIPAGKYCRITTSNTSGTPSFAYRSGQEVLL